MNQKNRKGKLKENRIENKKVKIKHNQHGKTDGIKNPAEETVEKHS